MRSSGYIGMEIFCSHRLLFRQIYRFAVTGGGTTILHVLLAIYLHEYALLSAFTSNLMAFLMAWVFSYLGNFYWTFDGAGQRHSQTMFSFMVLSVLGFLLNQSIVMVTTLYLGWNFRLSLLMVVITVPVFTFLVSKFIIFSK